MSLACVEPNSVRQFHDASLHLGGRGAGGRPGSTRSAGGTPGPPAEDVEAESPAAVLEGKLVAEGVGVGSHAEEVEEG
jgi:hypothetical protein